MQSISIHIPLVRFWEVGQTDIVLFDMQIEINEGERRRLSYIFGLQRIHDTTESDAVH